jgi:hypothetical protein
LQESTLAMGPEAIASIAAYIDLNPVRAGLVEDFCRRGTRITWSGIGVGFMDVAWSEGSSRKAA